MHGRPRQSVTDKLQRVLNAAARVVSDTLTRYDRGLSTLLQDEFHWPDVSERVTYKLGVMMHRVVCPVKHVGTSLIISFQHPESLLVFVYAPPTNTSSLFLAVDLRLQPSGFFDCGPDALELVIRRTHRPGGPARSFDSFRQFLKTILFSLYYSVTSALEVFLNGMRYKYLRFTYLLTYLLCYN